MYPCMSITWLDFENDLLSEFKAILTQFRLIEEDINEDSRKDFLGLLQYTLKTRNSFRSTAAFYGFNYTEHELDTKSQSKSLEFDISRIVKELIEKDLDSFASEYSHFPLILENCDGINVELLVILCIKYWKHRYPSIKSSFIIPLCAKIPQLSESSSQLTSLLGRRLLKGKLDPFDESIQVAKILKISPEATYFSDPQLAALKDILKNHQQFQVEHSSALEQSGCHCD